MKTSKHESLQVMSDAEARHIVGGWGTLSLGRAVVNAAIAIARSWRTTTTSNATSRIAHEAAHIVQQR